jgi:hypothetical protein
VRIFVVLVGGLARSHEMVCIEAPLQALAAVFEPVATDHVGVPCGVGRRGGDVLEEADQAGEDESPPVLVFGSGSESPTSPSDGTPDGGDHE